MSRLIEITGDVERYDAAVVSDAITDLLLGGVKLRKERFAIKDFSSYRGQRCDCPYGMGPRHGHHVFAVGIEQEARNRSWSPDEVRDAVCFLANLDELKLDQRRRQLRELRAKTIREMNILKATEERIATELRALEASALFPSEVSA